MNVTFRVPGIPQPRGSKRAMPNRAGGRPLMVDTNAKSKPWMAAIASAAQEAMDGRDLMQGCVRLGVQLMFPRPKSHYRTGRNSHLLRDDAPSRKASKPDCSKVLRAVEDAMSGVVYRDDAQIWCVQIQKLYTDGAAEAVIDVKDF